MIRNVGYIESVQNGRKNLEGSSVGQRIILRGILRIECECEHLIYWAQYWVEC